MEPSAEWELLNSIGEGSYGAVWKCVSKKNASQFAACKIIPVENDFDELQQETKILKNCSNDFVVQFIHSYSVETDGKPYLWIVMELCDGGSVSDLLHVCKVKLTEPTIRILVGSVLCGLSYLHLNKMIHRDIKAGNILLNSLGQAKLADFGVSVQLQKTVDKRKTVIGTPFWMAPEVIQESEYDCKADIWSLGITLIEMAEGEPPHHEIHPMRAIFMIPSRPPPVLAKPAEWSPDMSAFLTLCLQKSAEMRPSTSKLMEHPLVKNEIANFAKTKPKGCSKAIQELVSSNKQNMEEYFQKSHKAGSGRTVSTFKDEDELINLDDTLRSESMANGNTLKQIKTMKTVKSSQSVLRKSATNTGSFNSSDPAFMAYFQSMNKAKDGAATTTRAEMDKLRERMNSLEIQYDEDLSTLTAAYQKTKSNLTSNRSESDML